MNLLIAGDCVPTSSNYYLFNEGDSLTLLGDELNTIWQDASLRIFNCETPITDLSTPILKCGPNLMSPTSTIKGIEALNPSLISLANNHIMDQDKQGLLKTQELFNNANIPFVGVGNNIFEASKPYIIKKSGKKIGIYSCSEHEFSIATDKQAGANPFDLLESFDHIKKLRKEVDYLIVLYHGGKEHYRYPSPYLQKVCHKIIESGANLVVCQHSHCIGCEENYYNGKIVYGQGNFIFDNSPSEFWMTSLIINIDLSSCDISYIPIEKKKNLIKKSDNSQILEDFKERSREIKQDGFVEEKYSQFAKQNYSHYAYSFSGIGNILGKIDRHLFNNAILNKRLNNVKKTVLRNYIDCEAHRELLLKAFSIDK